MEEVEGEGDDLWHVKDVVSASREDETFNQVSRSDSVQKSDDVVLVSVAAGMDLESVSVALGRSGVATVDPSMVRQLTDGVIQLSLADGATVDDAIRELEQTGVVIGAQPDYIYTVDEERSTDDLIKLLEEAQSLDSTAGHLLPENDQAVMTPEDGVVPEEGSLEGEGEGCTVPSGEMRGSELAGASGLVELLAKATMPDDPYVDMQWGLECVHAMDAWELVPHTDGVAVAVIDAGFDVDHEDLSRAIIPESAYNAYRAASGAGDLTDVAPGPSTMDHGNFVAGIICAETNNGVGVAGVSGGARIVPIRAYNYQRLAGAGATTSAIVKAFDYAIAMRDVYNIRVINMCIGGAARTVSPDNLLFAKIDEAFEAGIVTVCSGGNGRGPFFNLPSDYPTAISVINLRNPTTRRDYTSGGVSYEDASDVERSSTSNFNDEGEMTKDISAPGTDILSTAHNSSVLRGETVAYGLDSGTSMAAPHVASVAAMVFSRLDVPKDAGGAQLVVDALMSGARDVTGSGFDVDFGFGVVDAGASLKALDAPHIEGPTYVAVGFEGKPFSVSAVGFAFSSSDQDVLEVRSDGSCVAHAVGSVVVSVSDGTTTMRKAVMVVGEMECPEVLATGGSASAPVESPSMLRWTWSTSDEDIVGVSQSGSLSAGDKAGVATVTASLSTADGAGPLEVTRDVWVVGPLAGEDTLVVGWETELHVDDVEGRAFDASEFAWESTDEGVATVDEAGVVHAVSAGVADIIAKVPGDTGPGLTFTVTVIDGDIAASQVLCEGPGAETYTGHPLTPTVALSLGGRELVEGQDYMLSYGDNVAAGIATVTVNGIGLFEGSSRQVTFEIEKASLTTCDVIPLEPMSYTGRPLEPVPQVFLGDVMLVEGEDFKVASYGDNVDAGMATVTLKGMGSLTGKLVTTFEIVPADISLCDFDELPDVVFTGLEYTPSPMLSNEGFTLEPGEDFTLEFVDNVDVGEATVICRGCGNFCGELTLHFNVLPAAIENQDIEDVAACPYMGRPIEPIPVVRVNGTDLVADVDYTVAYEENVSVGMARMVVVGQGNYAGEVVVPFEIVAADIATCRVEAPDEVCYTGHELTPVPRLFIGDVELEEGVDFDLFWSHNRDTGTAKMTCRGMRNLTGETILDFEIVPADISLCEAAPLHVERYDGKAKRPIPSLTLGDVRLAENKDFTLTYAGNVDVGTASVTCTGVGNFSGELTLPFEIMPQVLDSSDVGDIDGQVFSGLPLAPSPSVSSSGVTLAEGKDYTLVYESNVHVGTAIVTVEGIGNYGGSARVPFEISPASLEACDVVGLGEFVYTGQRITPIPVVSLGGIALVEGVDFQVEGYADNVDVGAAVVRLQGMGDFAGKRMLPFEIVAADISSCDAEALPDVSYTGLAHTPTPSLSLGGTALVAGRDFTLTYSGNVDAGVASVACHGVGNYTGELALNFRIAPQDISTCVASAIEDQTYTGSELRPTPCVVLGWKVLKEGVDYTVGYVDNVSVGTANIIMRGIGNFEGGLTVPFEIIENNRRWDVPQVPWARVRDAFYTYVPYRPRSWAAVPWSVTGQVVRAQLGQVMRRQANARPFGVAQAYLTLGMRMQALRPYLGSVWYPWHPYNVLWGVTRGGRWGW